MNRFCLTMLISTMTTAAYANVIVNGTFDNSSTGWTGSYSVLNGPGGGFPTLDTGPYYYAGGGANSISQEYVLTSTEQQQLLAGGLSYTMSADLFGFAGQNDFSVFTARFLDSASNEIGSVSLSGFDGDPGTWPSNLTAGTPPSFQSTVALLPFGTESISFQLLSNSQQFGSNDGYADNLSFAFNPIPEPTSLALLAFGGVAFALRLRR